MFSFQFFLTRDLVKTVTDFIYCNFIMNFLLTSID